MHREFRDEIHDLAIDIREIRFHNRKLKRTFNELCQEELNTVSFGLSLRELIEINEREKQEHRVIFDSIATDLFKHIPHQLKNSNGSAKLDIRYNHSFLTVEIDAFMVFRDLRKFASKFWHIPSSCIFFESELEEVYLLTSNVINEIYPWKILRTKDCVETVYLVHRVEELSSPDDILDTAKDHQEVTEITRVDDEDYEKELIQLEGKKEMKTIKLIIFVLTGLFILLFVMWFISGSLERSFIISSSLNSSLQASLLGDTSNQDDKEDFFRILSKSDMWDFSLELHSPVPYGGLFYFTRVFSYYQMRQHRSEVQVCGHDYIGDYLCSEGISLFSYSKKSFGDSGAFEYKDEDSNSFINGNHAYYSLDGFSIALDLGQIMNPWTRINELIQNNWIDMGTKAVFYTFNFYNPNVRVLTSLVCFVEIRNNEFYHPDYKIYTVKDDMFMLENSLIQIFIFLIVLACISIEIFLLTKPKESIEFVFYELVPSRITLSKRQMRKLLKKHKNKPFFKRFRKPLFLEILVLGVCIMIWALQLSKIVRHQELVSIKDSQTRYINLLSILSSFSVIYDIASIVGLFLGLILLSFIRIWSKRLIILSAMLNKVLKEFILVIFPFSLIIFGLILYLNFTLGTYSEIVSRFDLASLEFLSIFLGTWTIDRESLQYDGITSLLFFMLFSLFLRFILILLQISIITYQFSIAYEKIRSNN